ncbi:MAG: ABC transporter ATP-binding protein [Arenicellales bacterium]
MNEQTEEAPILVVSNAVRHFDSVIALDHVSIEARPHEFLTLLGPSGSGKTTLLRIIGGFETPTSIDRLEIGGQDVLDTPANHRNVATVFQHYGLFPHMSAGENVEYGLRVRGIAKPERKKRAMRALEMVRLGHAYGRRIHQLSGGERQRIALARAIVTEPAILLLDEPLGALDEKLRQDMQVELHTLQRELGTTFIHVTHSQEEALTMSDRVVLLNRGHIEQLGTPQELFEQPQTRFVADFMGVENIIDGRVGAVENDLAGFNVGDRVLHGRLTPGTSIKWGDDAFMAVRAEKVRLYFNNDDVDARLNTIPCTFKLEVYKGKYFDVVLDTGVGEVTGRIWDASQVGSAPAVIGWAPEDCLIGPVVREQDESNLQHTRHERAVP